jgi:hypothetical protein
MKYCPLTWISPKKFTNDECEMERCAWWNENMKECCIKTLCASKNPKTCKPAEFSEEIQTLLDNNLFLKQNKENESFSNSNYSFEIGV